jgi:hypothetical protein
MSSPTPSPERGDPAPSVGRIAALGPRFESERAHRATPDTMGTSNEGGASASVKESQIPGWRTRGDWTAKKKGGPHWKKAVRKKLREHRARSGDPRRINHTVQITSYGGSGTTAICDYLSDAGVDLPRTPDYFPFKHQRNPPSPEKVPEGFRAVYVYGDPRDVVVSLFRRGLQLGQYRWSHGGWRGPSPEVRQRLSSLESFLEAGIDELGLEDHLDRWLTRDPSGYPVLFVKYESLAEAWPTVRDFVGLAPSHPCLPLLPRESDWSSLPDDLRERLDRMYEGLVRRISAMPAAYIA